MNHPTAPRQTPELPAFFDEQDASAPTETAAAAADGATEPAATTAPATTATAAPAPRGGGLAAILALAAAGAAAAAGFVPTLPAMGPSTGALLACAAAFACASALQRRLARLDQRLAAADAERRTETEALHAQFATLAAQRTGDDGAGDVSQALLLLQRQDEKIANLTKAVKMYGTPLMEISTQVGELTSALGQLDQRFSALVARVAPTNLEPVTQALARVEVAVAAMSQRLDDGEARKSLFRLEEATQKTLTALDQLQRGENVARVGADLQARVDRATADLQSGLAKLREGSLGDLESVVREIQREMAGVATQVAQIGATVKGGARSTTTFAATPTTAPASAAEPTPATTNHATAPAPASPAPAAEATPPAADGGGYSTGARSSGGKNVLGAIAKLKQMKG
jgi:hypothetical protein